MKKIKIIILIAFVLFSIKALATVYQSHVTIHVGPCDFYVSIYYDSDTKHGSVSVKGMPPCNNVRGTIYFLPVPGQIVEPVSSVEEIITEYNGTIENEGSDEMTEEQIIAAFNAMAENPNY